MQKQLSVEARHEIEKIIAIGKEIVFEDGIDNDFSRAFVQYLRKYGENGIEVLHELVVTEKVNAEIIGEMLRVLGHDEDETTHRSRQWVLVAALNSKYSRIRDGAVLGISFMDDPKAIPYLKDAMLNEQIEELRDDMHRVLEQLEERE